MKLLSGRTIFVVLLALAPVIIGPAATYATNSTGSLFGQTQAYDVLLRGNGAAVVNARIEYQNHETQPISSLDYTVDGGQLGDVAAYQQIECTRLPVLAPNGTSAQSATGAKTSVDSLTRPSVTTPLIPSCYPTYYSRTSGQTVNPLYYYPSGVTYEKIKATKDDNGFRLTLPQPIEKGSSATIVMMYDATGYVHESLGRYIYQFKTLKSNESVSDVRVSVSVDEEFELAGAAKGRVNYRPLSSGALDTKLESGANIASSDAASASAYISSIGDNGSITKHASNLSAGETMTISGKFATSVWLLDWPWTLAKVLLALAVLGVIGFWVRHRRLKHRKERAEAAVAQNDAVDTDGKIHATSATGWVGSYVQRIGFKRMRPWIFGIVCGAASLPLLFAGIFGLFFVTTNSYSESGFWSVTAAILICVAMFLNSIITLIGLPIWYSGSFAVSLRVMGWALIFVVAAAITALVLAGTLDRLFQKSYPPYGCGGGVYSTSICAID